MELLQNILFIIGLIFILFIGAISIWAILKFARSYNYDRDDPLATLPKRKTFLEILSPKCKDGIFNTGKKTSSMDVKDKEH